MDHLNLNLQAVREASQTSSANDELRLSSIESLSVTREDVFDIPDGKEYFYDWQANDEKGLTTKFSSHSSRIDSYGSYTITLELSIQKIKPGTDIDADPAATTRHRVVVFGVKGETCGDVRNDRVFITTYAEDGTSAQEERTVAVQLDVDEFANQDFATMALNIGKYVIAQRS